MLLLTVGELAARSGVAASTLRYYDEIGLLVPRRLPNRHRRYPSEAVDQLDLVRLCQALGCSLEEIRTILGPGGGAARRVTAARKLVELEATMARLDAARALLGHMAVCEHAAQDAAECRHTVRRALADVEQTGGRPSSRMRG